MPEDDWHVALLHFQYISQKWGSLTYNEHIIGIQYFGPVTKKFVMDWTAVGKYKVHVNGTESKVQKINYTWEELQAQIKNVFNLTLTTQNERRKKQKKPKITAELLFLTSDIIKISKDSESEFDVTFSPPLATLSSSDKMPKRYNICSIWICTAKSCGDNYKFYLLYPI